MQSVFFNYSAVMCYVPQIMCTHMKADFRLKDEYIEGKHEK